MWGTFPELLYYRDTPLANIEAWYTVGLLRNEAIGGQFIFFIEDSYSDRFQLGSGHPHFLYKKKRHKECRSIMPAL